MCPSIHPCTWHLSNFFGHATMTAVAGHHCGHTSLGEVALCLRALYGVDCGIATENLAQAATIVESRTRVPRRLDQPIIGPYAFLGDGAYWAAEAAVPFEDRIHATFPIPPQLVGASERVVWSDRTATVESIRTRASQAGIDSLSDEECERVIAALRQVIEEKADYPGWLDDSEFGQVLTRAGHSER
jgi:isopropylmalate/homocitrate/citramalate synthase